MSRPSIAALFLLVFAWSAGAAEAIPPIERVLPPVGLEIPADVRARLEQRLAETKQRLKSVSDSAQTPDVEVFTKAVELALVHREFYALRDFAKADWALDEANKRLDSLAQGQTPWTKTTGLVVRGYRSPIDNSAQPYGLVIPKDHDFSKPTPLYVWLHGRGDKNTDLHFLQERATRPGQITPPNAIVVHPFGRHCLGWKHAGEIDVLHVTDAVTKQCNVDPNRIVLIGFSMGGAGAWHIGAHYTDRWVAVSPGAGFVDTKRYQNITADQLPAEYVQKLWGLYDVPDYVRNLFNTNVIAYSGELDAQRKAAVIMEEAFQGEGHQLTHLIGPGVGHAYEPEVLKELLQRLDAIVAKGKQKTPEEVHLQTRSLRYSRSHWVGICGLERHWEDARVDARIAAPKLIKATTKNVSVLQVWLQELPVEAINIDDQEIPIQLLGGSRPEYATFLKTANVWRRDPTYRNVLRQAKTPGRQGPIDDAFLNWFVVVAPTGKSKNPAFQAWVDFELSHFRDRWRSLMRGDLPVVLDSEFNLKAWNPAMNVVLWGDADSNAVIKQLAEQLPRKVHSREMDVWGHDIRR